MVRQEFLTAIKAGQEGRELSREKILLLLSSTDEEENQLLLSEADRVRQNAVGDEVHLRAIVEFSNYCVQNCLYCGLRRDNHELVRYRMSPAEIVEVAIKAKTQGFQTVVLQSGEDSWFTGDRLAGVIQKIKEQADLAITLSVGERTYADYWAWKKAGADRYLLKYETTSPALFKNLRPERDLADRLKALGSLQELGYEVGSGNMVGLPGQTNEDLAADIQLFCKMDFDMIGIGPFIAHPQTPLARVVNGELGKVLKVLAITRIVTKDTNLPATTATGIVQDKGQQEALLSGANVIMLNVTPSAYRKHYQIYPGKERSPLEMQAIPEMLFSLRRKIGLGKGQRIHSRPAEKPESLPPANFSLLSI